jgi:glycosidase
MIARTSRDNARTPMQWSDGEGSGFTSGKPWLKINGNYKEINVERENGRENGVLAFWKKMISMRKTDKVLCDGYFRVLHEGKRVYAFERSLDGRRLVSVCNMSGKVAKLPKLLEALGAPIVSSYADIGVELKPFEFRLYETEGEA